MNKYILSLKTILFWGLLFSLFLLPGCAAVTEKPLNISHRNSNNFIIQGKIGIQSPQKNGSASLYWQQYQNSIYHIRLFGPLGMGAVNLNGSPQKIVLIDSQGRVYTARSPELLLKQNLGWTVPVSSLKYWIRGLPNPDFPSQLIYNHNNQLNNQLSCLKQQDWVINYLSYQNHLPRLIQLDYPQIRLRIVIDDWKFFD